LRGGGAIRAAASQVFQLKCLSLKPVVLNQPANEIETMLLGDHFAVFDLFSDVVFHIDKPRGIFFRKPKRE